MLKRGGTRPGAGRKSIAEEAGLANLIDSAVTQKDWKIIFQKASEQAKKGNTIAARFLAEYRFGKPRRLDVTLPIDLNQLSTQALERIAAGENVITVLASESAGRDRKAQAQTGTYVDGDHS